MTFDASGPPTGKPLPSNAVKPNSRRHAAHVSRFPTTQELGQAHGDRVRARSRPGGVGNEPSGARSRWNVRMADRLIRLRYSGTCAGCDEPLAPRTMGWWDSNSKTVRCETCGSVNAPANESPAAPATVPNGDAGSSA